MPGDYTDPNDPYGYYQYQNYGGQGSRTKNWADYQAQAGRGGTNGGVTGAQTGTTQQDMARAILGGPVGWYEAATGKSLLGDSDPFDGTTLNAGMTEEIYNSMSPEEWQHFAKLGRAGQQEWIAQRTKELASYNKRKNYVDPAIAEQKAKEEAYQKWRNDVMTRLDDFSKKMGMSVDQLIASGDAGVQAAQNTGLRAGAAQGLGLSGGLSTLNSQKAAADSMNAYQMQRQQMGLNATSALMGGLQQQYMNDEDRRRYEQGLNLQLQQAQGAAQQQLYNQKLQQSGGTLGLIGAGVGAYFGGAAGAQAGYSLGSGLGQQQYMQNNPYRPYQYRYPSSTGGGSGLGGRYGGAQ